MRLDAGRSLTVVEAEVVAQFSSDDRLLHERLHPVWKPPRGLHLHDRGLYTHLPHVEVRRHVRAHVLVRVVGKVREPFQPAVDEGLQVVTRRLRSRNEPGYLCRRRDQINIQRSGTVLVHRWHMAQNYSRTTSRGVNRVENAVDQQQQSEPCRGPSLQRDKIFVSCPLTAPSLNNGKNEMLQYPR